MKIFTTIFYSVFVCLIVGIAGLLIATMLPIPGNIEMKIVKSGSMEPAIPTGSLIVVRPQTNYALNEVITFGEDTKSQIPTTHRIIDIQNDGTQTVFITKGDANEESDTDPVRKSDVIGRVVVHVPAVGFILDFARQPIGFTLLIAIPAGLVILEELLTILREAKRGLRRRKGSDENDGGAPPTESPSTLQMVYVKKRVMDEIYIPMMLEIENASALIAQKGSALQKRLATDSYATSSALVMGLICVVLSMGNSFGGTLAYFSDIEKSVGNILRAGTWEDETPTLDPEVSGRSFVSEVLVSDEEAPLDIPTENITSKNDTRAENDAPIVVEQTLTETRVEEIDDMTEGSSEPALSPSESTPEEPSPDLE